MCFTVYTNKLIFIFTTLIACHDVHVCATNPSVDRDMYREYVAGVMSALFGTYLQGNHFQSNYLTATDLIPFKMGAFFVDVNCQ